MQIYTSYLKINHFVDNIVNSIALIPLDKINSIEYYDGSIRIDTNEKSFYYSIYDVDHAVKFIEYVTDFITDDKTLKNIYYYQHTSDCSKSRISKKLQ